MTIDASIPLSVRPAQLDNPVDMYGKAVSLKSLMLQSQGQELALQDAQRLRGIYSQGVTDPGSLRDMLYNGGFPDKALAMDKDVLANKASAMTIEQGQGNIGKQKMEMESQLAGAFVSAPPEQQQALYPAFVNKWKELKLSNWDKLENEQFNPAFLPHLQQIANQGLTADQQWQHGRPQSDLGKTVSDASKGLLGGGQGSGIDPGAAKIAVWHAAGNKAPEGQIAYVDADGTVKTKTDPNWLASKSEIAKNSATVVNNNIGGKSFNEKFGALQAGQIEAEQKKAQGASDTILTMHKVRDAIDNGVFIGGKLADTKLAVTQVLQGLHVPLPKNWDNLAVNSSEFNSFVGAQLLQHAKDLGTNPSNADAGRIDKILGKLGTDPKALIQVMDFNEEMARKAIDRFNSHLGEAQANAKSAGDGTYGFDMSIAQPGKWASSKPAQNPNIQPTQQRPGAMAPTARPTPAQVNSPVPVSAGAVDPVSGAQVRPANLQPQKTIKWEDLN